MTINIDVEKLKQMQWFHSFDFGNGITVTGLKSLDIVQSEAHAYFGNLDLTGASVLRYRHLERIQRF